MPLQETSGSASYDAFGGGVAERVFIEEVFSTWLYTGNGSTQTITNGIDLSTKGGLVWVKGRSAASSNILTDTVRGAGTSDVNNNALSSNESFAEDLGSSYDYVSAFSSTGFSVAQGGTTTGTRGTNYTSVTYASWTFRKQPKFFDVVTYTGTGSARTVAHNLGSVPGCIIVKRLDTGENWQVYHRTQGNTKYLLLNSSVAAATSSTRWNNTTPTSTLFTVGTAIEVNESGGTYVAYLFAHDAGGFGLSGTDNVISCGSFTTDGSGNASPVTLGYEPQFLLVKRSDGVGGAWYIIDIMRQFNNATNSVLYPNSSDAEGIQFSYIPTATGFSIVPGSINFNATYIYIAIRRGPMKVPTSGTSVFSPIAYSGANGAAQNISAGFPVDMDIIKIRNDGTRDPLNHARLMGGVFLKTDSTAAQLSFSDNIVSFSAGQNVIGLPATGGGTNEINGASTSNYIAWAFRRAPGFMDVVCYNRGSGATVTHNLGVIPELLIVKRRGGTEPWGVMRPNTTGYLLLNAADALNTGLSATATSTTFTLGTGAFDYTDSYVAYLFATVAGVSKVFSFTGNGSSQTINCGFTGGARFVMIKRIDSTGDWYVWDSARGIVSGNDPHLSLNTTAAEVTTDDSVDTDSTGFIVNQLAATNINVSSASYIFLAVA